METPRRDPLPAAERTPTARILVLEDEPQFAKVLDFVLTNEGYEVTALGDGREGLQEAATGRYDLCLLNVMLPGLDGFGLARELARQEIDLPLVFVTGILLNEFLERSATLPNCAGYVRKPFLFSQLIDMVDLALTGGWGDGEDQPGPRRT